MVSIKAVLALVFGIAMTIGIIAFVYGLGHATVTVFSAPWTPQDQLLQNLSSDGSLIEVGFVLALIGGIGVYALVKLRD